MKLWRTRQKYSDNVTDTAYSHSAGQSDGGPPDCYNDGTCVSSHEYPPPAGKGTDHLQHGMSGFGGARQGYPPFEGQDTQNLPLVSNPY